MFCVIFFFKQKTAYVMRISDWSSDVCSSDLPTSSRRPAMQPPRCMRRRASASVVVRQDRIVQVLINLISNAVKFTPQGSIRCEARRLGVDLVEFAVVDTGIGIARDERASVFEKFRQVGDTLTDKPKGTGLGLEIGRAHV